MNFGGPPFRSFVPGLMSPAQARSVLPARPALPNGLVPGSLRPAMTPLNPRGFAPGEPTPGLPMAQPPTVMNDAVANQIVAIWKGLFSDAMLLPVIGLPSNNNGVMTLTHTMQMPGMPPPPPLTINGLPTKSPLGNNALFSSELSNGRWLNLYEIMIPDIAGANGALSSGEKYVAALEQSGISVGGDHYHWKGGRMLGQFPLAIHSQTTSGMDPVEFSNKHIAALRYALGLTR